MDVLARKKESLEKRLQDLHRREVERGAQRARLAECLDAQRSNLEERRLDLENIRAALLEKRRRFLLLKNEVRAYKKTRINGVRADLEVLYRQIFEEASQIHPSQGLSAFSDFSRIKDLMRRNVFAGLGRRLGRFYNEQKEALKSHVLEQIAARMQDKRRIHEMMFYMRLLHRYEEHFQEAVIVDFLYERLLRGFEYHFMSSKESNRLDKPEWFLEFILQKIAEDRDVFEMYSNVQGSEERTDFRDLVLRSCSLIEIKMGEIAESGSRQKRNLLVNLAVHLLRFQTQILKTYDVRVDLSGVGFALCREQRDHVQRRLAETHEKKYVHWFEGYRELSKECLLYIHRFRMLDTEFKMECVVQTIIEYNTVLLESLRYINREEVRVLCLLYSEFEEFKVFLLDQENEIVFDSRLTVEPLDGDGFCDAVLEAVEMISRFNSENLQLIMSLATNDVISVLRLLRGFVYSPGETARAFVADAGRLLEDYRRCSSYEAVKSRMQEKIDAFVLEEILLHHRLDTEQYFEAVELLKRLRELFGDAEWKSEAGCRCVGHLFEGTEGAGSLFGIVKELYKQ